MDTSDPARRRYRHPDWSGGVRMVAWRVDRELPMTSMDHGDFDENFGEVEVGADGSILWHGKAAPAPPDVEILAYQFEIGFQVLQTAQPEQPTIFHPESVLLMQFMGVCGEPDHDHTLRVMVPVKNARDFAMMLQRALDAYDG